MNLYELYSNFLFAKAGSDDIPLSGTFELTARCNLNCKMCYIHERANDAKIIKRERSAKQWLALAKECADAGMLMLLLTGGEPTVRKDFKEIYTGCRKLGLLVSINSNATLMTDEIIDFLAEDPPARVNITLYGASPETYEKLCGDASAYDRAIHSILRLKEKGVLVKLNCSVTQYNRHDAEKIYQFAKDNNIVVQTATYMFPPIRAIENGGSTATRMTAMESAIEQLKYDKFRFDKETLCNRFTNECNGIKVADPDNECQELPTERIKCRAGHTTFWVTWDWKLRPCGMMTVPSVDIEEGHFLQAWNKIHAMREEIMIPAKCTNCEVKNMCDQCPALCYAETGSFTQAPQYMCDRTYARLALIKEELKKMNDELDV